MQANELTQGQQYVVKQVLEGRPAFRGSGGSGSYPEVDDTEYFPTFTFDHLTAPNIAFMLMPFWTPADFEADDPDWAFKFAQGNVKYKQDHRHTLVPIENILREKAA